MRYHTRPSVRPCCRPARLDSWTNYSVLSAVKCVAGPFLTLPNHILVLESKKLLTCNVNFTFGCFYLLPLVFAVA